MPAAVNNNNNKLILSVKNLLLRRQPPLTLALVFAIKIAGVHQRRCQCVLGGICHRDIEHCRYLMQLGGDV